MLLGAFNSPPRRNGRMEKRSYEDKIEDPIVLVCLNSFQTNKEDSGKSQQEAVLVEVEQREERSRQLSLSWHWVWRGSCRHVIHTNLTEEWGREGAKHDGKGIWTEVAVKRFQWKNLLDYGYKYQFSLFVSCHCKFLNVSKRKCKI